MLKILMSCTFIAPLAACMATPDEPRTASAMACKDAALNGFTGVKATQSSGADILKASGARHLRWVGPDMAVTMDYRPDRLTVSYNQAMEITSARCG